MSVCIQLVKVIFIFRKHQESQTFWNMEVVLMYRKFRNIEGLGNHFQIQENVTDGYLKKTEVVRNIQEQLCIQETLSTFNSGTQKFRNNQ